MQQVLNTTTSADSRSGAATIPSAVRAPARRSESCSFIWHPKVRMWNVRGDVAIPSGTGRSAGTGEAVGTTPGYDHYTTRGAVAHGARPGRPQRRLRGGTPPR